MGESHFKPEFPALLAPGFHYMSLDAARRLLVDNFTTSVSRQAIFEGLEQVLRKLSDDSVECEVWLDGSFITQKINPTDVDMVVRVSADIYNRQDRRKASIDWATSEDREDSHSCDSYAWLEYPIGHHLHDESEKQRRYWTGWFGTSPMGAAKGLCVIRLPLAEQ